MRGILETILALTVVVGLSGCRNQYAVQRPIATTEPPLVIGSADVVPGNGPAIVASPSGGFVERHPMLSRPGQYYNSTSGGKIAKTASAAFIGVPSGIIGEMRQIVTGQPAPVVAVGP